MIQLFLILLFIVIPSLIFFAFIWFIFYLYKKLRLMKFMILITLLSIFIVLAWMRFEHRLIIYLVPDCLGVDTVIYKNQEFWGFGPGGNEVGIIFYNLPNIVSKNIKRERLNYFSKLPENRNQKIRKWRGRYEHWKETPIEGEDWKINPSTGFLNIKDYICAYGFCIDIPEERLQKVNEIVSKSGSYYAYGRIGVIVVSPEENLVIYFHRG